MKKISLNRSDKLIEFLISQQTLYHREAESIVRSIVNNILDNVRTPERARSPVGFYMTEQEQFQQKNPDVRSIKKHDKIYQFFSFDLALLRL
jgi:hypothetical protein